VFPYLGPEIIAVIKAAGSSSPNDSRSGPRLLFSSKREDRIIPLRVSSLNLNSSKLRSVGVIHVWVYWRR
jgi:hypothetical protein